MLRLPASPPPRSSLEVFVADAVPSSEQASAAEQSSRAVLPPTRPTRPEQPRPLETVCFAAAHPACEARRGSTAKQPARTVGADHSAQRIGAGLVVLVRPVANESLGRGASRVLAASDASGEVFSRRSKARGADRRFAEGGPAPGQSGPPLGLRGNTAGAECVANRDELGGPCGDIRAARVHLVPTPGTRDRPAPGRARPVREQAPAHGSRRADDAPGHRGAGATSVADRCNSGGARVTRSVEI